MTTTYLQNGQVQTSSALTQTQMENIWQILCCQMLGVTAQLPLQCNLFIDNDVIATELVAVNLAAGFIAEAPQLPEFTTIVSLVGSGQSLLITLSDEATATANSVVLFSDPSANIRVRIEWPEQGSPAWGITTDVLFVRCTEQSNSYDLLRDEITNDPTNNQVIKTCFYTRVWNVYLIAYGLNSFDSLRLIKSLLLEDFSHDSLQLSNLFVVPALGASVRNPEFFNGQWWERSDFAFQVYEYVTETINIPIAATIEVIASTATDQLFDKTFPLQE